MLIRKSGIAGRVADLTIDHAAKQAAAAVRAANREGATERFLARFLDHLHDADNEARMGQRPPGDDPRRRRRPG